MTVIDTSRCTLAEWDSAFFGRRIGRFDMDRPVAPDVAQAVSWAGEHAIDCLYALVDADAVESVRALEGHGFGLMDIRLTLDRPSGASGAAPAGIEIGEPHSSDRDALLALARTSHRGTRFTEDPGFDAARASELYAAWLDAAMQEPDALVLVPRSGGRACGYLTLHGVSGPTARVGVLAVAPELRGRGIGHALVADGLRRAQEQGASQVSVVTQGGNADSVRFYERCGFEARRSQLWYHRWFTP